jgi:hypothetical protein
MNKKKDGKKPGKTKLIDAMSPKEQRKPNTFCSISESMVHGPAGVWM